MQDVYRTRWWRPILGPTATALLDIFCTHRTDEWMTRYLDELCVSVGIGHRRPKRLHGALERLVYNNFATFDVEPNHPDSPICEELERIG